MNILVFSPGYPDDWNYKLGDLIKLPIEHKL